MSDFIFDNLVGGKNMKKQRTKIPKGRRSVEGIKKFKSGLGKIRLPRAPPLV